VGRTSSSRINRDRIVAALRAASRKGDRHALTVAIDQMRTLALTPRYWEKYLVLLKNPLARLVDLLVIKQGHRIAHQKGWKLPRPSGDDGGPPPASVKKAPPRRKGRRARPRAAESVGRQPSLFD
jgi:hypothetical protein